MAKINIEALEIGTFTGSEAPYEARLYASKSFTGEDDRRVVGGKIDSKDFCLRIPVLSVTSGIIALSQCTGVDAVESTVNQASDTGATYTLALYTERGRRLAILYSGLKLPYDGSITSWPDMDNYSRTVAPPPPTALYPTWAQIYAYLAGFSLAGLASVVTAGKSKLTFTPTSPSDPIAVGAADPVWTGIRQTYYLDSYGSNQSALTAALGAMGSVTPCELRVTKNVNVTNNTPIPANVLVSFEGNGSFTVSSSRTLTIRQMRAAPSKQIFFGAGDVVLDKNAHGGTMHLEWWAAPDGVSDSTHAMDQVKASLILHKGGTLKAGNGTWLFNAFDMPSYTSIEGSGMWDGNGLKTGTVFQLYDTGSGSYLIKASEAFRSCSLKNLCLNVGVSDLSNCLLLEGNYPNTAVAAFRCQRVSFIGTAASSTPQIKVNTLNVQQWECTSISFENCLAIVPADTRHFSINTVNSGPTFKGCEFICAAGATALYLLKTGFTNIVDCQFRGVSGSYPDTTSLDRTISAKGNLTSGSPYLDLTSPAVFKEGDVGNKVTIGVFSSYIKSIELVAGVASRALLMSNSSINATNADVAVYRFVPNTSLAYTGVHIAGSHTNINYENCVDEGFQYSIVHEGEQNEYPVNFKSSTFQGRILVKGSCTIESTGNNYKSQQFIDNNAGMFTRIISKGDFIDKASVNLFDGTEVIVLTEAELWAERLSDSIVQFQESFSESDNRAKKEASLDIYDRSTSGSADPLALLRLASARAASQFYLWWGRLHPTTKRPDLGYELGYEYATGLALFRSNLPDANKGYKFDAKVMAPLGSNISTSTSVTFTSADYNQLFIWAPSGTATGTLPANGAPIGTFIDVLLINTSGITISAATADTLIAPNDTQADSITFTVGNRAGAYVRFISTGSYWVAVNLGSTTMAVNT